MWANHLTLVVIGKGVTKFKEPNLETEKVLVALQRGFPIAGLAQQGQMIGVNPRVLASMLDRLAPHLIRVNPERRNCKLDLRSAELNRGELNSEIGAAELSKHRRNWMVLLSGAESGVRGLTPMLESAGLRVKRSPRGWQGVDGEPDHLGWQFSHRVGNVSDSINQISVGFFHESIDPVTYRYWLSRGQTHIAIVFNQFGAKVSRLVRPGLDYCLECDPDFQSPAGASRASLHFQAKDHPLAFDDTRTAAWAVMMAVNRLLDWVDFGGEPGVTLFLGEHEPATGRPAEPCGCLIDSLELETAQEARGKQGSTV